MTAMFDQQYIDRAMAMVKTGTQFFWEPTDQWYFAAQREYKIEKYRQTMFEALPIFFETRVEVWPHNFRVDAMRFKPPYPNLIMLYHGDMCVWNRGVAKPTDKHGNILKDSVVKIDFNTFVQEAIISIQGLSPELCKTLQGNWLGRSRPLSRPH